MNALKCPYCDSVAEFNLGEPDDEVGGFTGGSVSCPNGHEFFNPEGLLVTSEGEVGEGGLLISWGNNPSAQITSLLQTIRSLESAAPSDQRVVDLTKKNVRKRNLRKAKRRFHRWVKDSDNHPPAIVGDLELRQLAERLVSEAQNQIDNSSDWELEDISKWNNDGLLEMLKSYEFYRDTEPILVLATAIPEDLRRAFDEAKECRRWGLSNACFALCRRILDIALDRIENSIRDETWPLPVDKYFLTRMNCFPLNLLSAPERKWITNFWRSASRFLHGHKEAKDAWQTLEKIAAILQRLAERGAFARGET